MPPKVGRKRKPPLAEKDRPHRKGPPAKQLRPSGAHHSPGVSPQPTHCFPPRSGPGSRTADPPLWLPRKRKRGGSRRTPADLWPAFSCVCLFSLQRLQPERHCGQTPVLHNLMLRVLSGGLTLSWKYGFYILTAQVNWGKKDPILTPYFAGKLPDSSAPDKFCWVNKYCYFFLYILFWVCFHSPTKFEGSLGQRLRLAESRTSESPRNSKYSPGTTGISYVSYPSR